MLTHNFQKIYDKNLKGEYLFKTVIFFSFFRKFDKKTAFVKTRFLLF